MLNAIFGGLFILSALIVVSASVIFTLDDFFIDFYALIFRIKPRRVNVDFIARIKREPEKKIAILIANWHEAEVIGPMIRGNIRGIEYSRYTFFLGVYPNDTETWQVASRLQELNPGKVTVIVNSKPGPTSKGQMLNEMVKQILASETVVEPYDLFLMQDSEDVFHRYSLSLMNHYSRHADFVQIPVFSFDVAKSSLVSGIYIDEFSESHTKDLLVRKRLGAAVPSAGVGTLLSHELVVSLCEAQNGNFLMEDTLTEDYHLGLMTKQLGFRSEFACVVYEREDGRKEFIATREYFPANLFASIRQKSRWTLGIAFQGMDNFSWRGDFVDKYFMWRDRRGPWNSMIVVTSFVLLWIFITCRAFDILPEFFHERWFQLMLMMTTGNMLIRILQRMRAVFYTNAREHVVLVPLRWLLANFINAMATFKAYRQYKTARLKGEQPKWIKTAHRLPENFGKEGDLAQ